MTQPKRAVLQGQIAHLQYLNREADPDEHRLFARQRASRIAMLEKELALLGDIASEASVTVTFEGDSVSGSQSMGVKLMATTMAAFQQVVGLVAGSTADLEATASGRPRSANVDDLHFTSVAHGSFGYHLEVRQTGVLFPETHTGPAIEQTLELLDAAGHDEDKFLDAIGDLPGQVLTKLKAFVAPVKKDHGMLRLVTATREVQLNREEVVLAYERITDSFTEDETQSLAGIFRGVHTASRRFEFEMKGGLVEKGDINEEVSAETIEAYAKQYVNKDVLATFQVFSVKLRRGAEKKSYTLLDIREL